MNLDAPRVLVLNAAYEVLGLASIKRAVLLVLGGGAEMVSESGLYLNTPPPGSPSPASSASSAWSAAGRGAFP